MGRPESPDPSRRNVIVLDDFRTADNPIRGTTPRSHGEAISRPLETQGYNVYRVQDSELDGKGKNTSGAIPLTTWLSGFKRENGRSGDVVNLSFGQDEKLTFKDVNRMAGYRGDQQLSRESLNAERVKQLRETLQQRLDDPKSGMSRADRERVKDILANAAGVDKLKSMGLVVINAGGNEGPDGLHPGFLNSTHSLRKIAMATEALIRLRCAMARPNPPGAHSFRGRWGAGVDVNNDGIPDFEHRPNGAEQLSGTSFSVLEFLRRKYPASLNSGVT